MRDLAARRRTVGPLDISRVQTAFDAYLNIPAFILSSRELCRPAATVLDPFCGSGTVLLESSLAGHDSFGADSNPLARLIGQAKMSAVEPARLDRVADRFANRIPAKAPSDTPDVVNLEYWFHPRIWRALQRVLAVIKRKAASAYALCARLSRAEATSDSERRR
jgi:hypothetical protein